MEEIRESRDRWRGIIRVLTLPRPTAQQDHKLLVVQDMYYDARSRNG